MRDVLRSIRDVLSRTDATRLQNILMRIPDKVCAAAFPTLSDALRDRLYALMGATKAARVQEEIRIEARRRTSAVVRGRLLRSFLAYLTPGATSAPRVWIKPVRRQDA